MVVQTVEVYDPIFNRDSNVGITNTRALTHANDKNLQGRSAQTLL